MWIHPFHSEVLEIQVGFFKGILAEIPRADKNIFHLIKTYNFMVARVFSLISQMSLHRPLCLVPLMECLAFSYFSLFQTHVRWLLNEIITVWAWNKFQLYQLSGLENCWALSYRLVTTVRNGLWELGLRWARLQRCEPTLPTSWWKIWSLHRTASWIVSAHKGSHLFSSWSSHHATNLSGSPWWQIISLVRHRRVSLFSTSPYYNYFL